MRSASRFSFFYYFFGYKMEFSSSIGVIAAILTTVAFVPQVWRVMRTRDTNAISLLMYLLFSTGVTLWLVYGVMLWLWPIIIANTMTLVLALIVIFFKVRCSSKPLQVWQARKKDKWTRWTLFWVGLRIQSNNVGKFTFIESLNVRRKNRISAKVMIYKCKHLQVVAWQHINLQGE